MQTYTINQTTLKAQYVEVARNLFGKKLKELNPYELNAVIAHVVKNEVITRNWQKSMDLYSEQRIGIYLSIEFLIGRVVLMYLRTPDLEKLLPRYLLRKVLISIA